MSAEPGHMDTSPSRHPFLRSKLQVGSAKGDTINHFFGQRVFHSSDVPKEAMEAKRAVQKKKQANILGIEVPDWNQSTVADPRIQKDAVDLKRQLRRARSGLMDDRTLKPLKLSKAHTDEAIADWQRYIVASTGQGPIGKLTGRWFNAVDERGLSSHSIEEKWPNWNVSHSAHTKEDVKQAQEAFDRKEARRMRMMQKDPKLDTSAYIDPMRATANLNDALREQKIEFQELKDQFKRELKVEFPRASEERLQAMAQRLLNEQLLADEKAARFPVQHQSFRPNMALTAQDRRHKEYHHPGSWSWNDLETRYCWSCCLNFNEDSRGCEWKVVNPDAWCTLGFERRPGVAAAWK